MPLNLSIKTMHGVGDKRQAILGKMGIYTIGDLLYHAPFKYQQLSDARKISECKHGDEVVVHAEVSSKPLLRRMRKGFSIVTFNIFDGNTTGKCVYFNQPYMAKNIYKGSNYIFIGKIDAKQGVIQMQNPTLIKSTDELPPVLCTYKLVKGIGQVAFKNLIKKILAQELGAIEEVFPDTFRKRHNLPEINFTFEHLHFPDSIMNANLAKYRLAFEEMLMFMIALENKKKESISDKAHHYEIDKNLIATFCTSLDFDLTNSQNKVIKEIIDDMQSPAIMSRLLQGDVGSGKTIPASIAMLIAASNKKQSAMMAPTDILASQHFDTISKLLVPFDVEVALLKSMMPLKEKNEVLKDIQSGKIDIIIGTHALIQKSVEYYNLGLVITDEQHRFGVAQRAKISAKGLNPDTLVMSATPVPRTLALILYGDLSISIIDEMPPGRIPVKTRLIKQEKRKDMYKYIKEHLDEGNRAYIVCPLIDESEKLDVRSTYKLYDELSSGIFKDSTIEVLHGQQKNEEKQEIMDKFRSGDIQCVISTTVIEVGLDVPEATFMVVENAERFGLAQLHQLRGRVGRGNTESWCFLVSSSEGQNAQERLSIMTNTNDGFIIAEEDLKLRGPGQFIGTQQSGMMDPRVLSLMGDVKLLSRVKDAIDDLTLDMYKDEKESIKKIALMRYNQKLKNIILN
ncbi:MAG: ATP-dependent DNA helicase RecG [Clostridiales bacterium]|nr:ATP-dependent DNA helicase RecG [Clostridiales bacterium]